MFVWMTSEQMSLEPGPGSGSALDPDSHSQKNAGSGSAQNVCRSETLSNIFRYGIRESRWNLNVKSIHKFKNLIGTYLPELVMKVENRS